MRLSTSFIYINRNSFTNLLTYLYTNIILLFIRLYASSFTIVIANPHKCYLFNNTKGHVNILWSLKEFPHINTLAVRHNQTLRKEDWMKYLWPCVFISVRDDTTRSLMSSLSVPIPSVRSILSGKQFRDFDQVLLHVYSACRPLYLFLSLYCKKKKKEEGLSWRRNDTELSLCLIIKNLIDEWSTNLFFVYVIGS